MNDENRFIFIKSRSDSRLFVKLATQVIKNSFSDESSKKAHKGELDKVCLMLHNTRNYVESSAHDSLSASDYCLMRNDEKRERHLSKRH